MSPPRLHVAEQLAVRTAWFRSRATARTICAPCSACATARRCGCSTPATANGRARIAAVGRHKVEIRVGAAPAPAGAGARADAGLRADPPQPAGLADREGGRARRRPAGAGADRAHGGPARQRPSGLRPSPSRPPSSASGSRCRPSTRPVPLAEWLALRDGAAPLLFAEERGGASPLVAALRRWPGAELLVGPEGGFSERERAQCCTPHRLPTP